MITENKTKNFLEYEWEKHINIFVLFSMKMVLHAKHNDQHTMSLRHDLNIKIINY